MSTISEVDLRDWEQIRFPEMRKTVMDLSHNESISLQNWDLLFDFFDSVQKLRDKQINDAQRKIPAILRKGEE